MKLTETDLKHIISECVKNVLNELSTDTIDNAREKAEISNYAYTQREKQPISQRKQLRNAYEQGFGDQWDKYHNK